MEKTYPTGPDRGLLSRSMEAGKSERLGKMAGVIDRVVDFGTRLTVMIAPNSVGKDMSFNPALMLMHHMVETADAISVLFRRACIDPSGSLLRSEIESAFKLFYLTQEDGERRGKAFRFKVLKQRAIVIDRADTGTNVGREVNNRRLKDKALKDMRLNGDSKTLSAKRAEVESLIAQPIYAEIREEWERLEKGEPKPSKKPAGDASGSCSKSQDAVRPKEKKRRLRDVDWYMLFDGPATIEQLAERVERASWYDFFYRHFSGEVHAGNIMDSFRANTTTRRGEIRPLRHSGDAGMCFRLCVSVTIEVYERMITKFMPEYLPSFAAWYAETISVDFIAG